MLFMPLSSQKYPTSLLPGLPLSVMLSSLPPSMWQVLRTEKEQQEPLGTIRVSNGTINIFNGFENSSNKIKWKRDFFLFVSLLN